MSREYARRSRGGGNLPLIIAIVGTVIVIAVILYFLLGSGGSGAGLFAKATDSPTPQPTYTPVADTPTPGPSPSPTPAPTVQVIVVSESPSAVIQEATATPTPAKVYSQATIWANSLNVREGPGMDYGKIGTVKRGQSFKVWDETSKWIKIQLPSGSYGWIWEDYTVRGDNPSLPAAPTSVPADSIVSTATIDSGSTKITITFKEAAYGSSTPTDYVNIPKDAFTVKEGSTERLTSVSACGGGTTIELTLSGATPGAEIKLTVDGGKIYDANGEDTGDYSKTFNAGADVTKPTVSFSGGTSTKTITATFSENIGSSSDGTGSLDTGDFYISGGYSVTIDSASSSGKTATIVISFTGMNPGDASICALTLKADSAYDAAGNACSQTAYNFTYTEPNP